MNIGLIIFDLLYNINNFIMVITKTQLKNILYKVNGAAITVHRALGPGLLESVYHRCFLFELERIGLSYKSELRVPLIYESLEFDTSLRCDVFIENTLVVELKSVDVIAPIHQAQVLTYMRLLHAPEGVIYNFNVVNLYKDGQQTLVNDLYRNMKD